MANKKGISAALKRNLKDGKEYTKLIPPVRCERTPLGEGDTFFTVDAMKDWIEKFSSQTAKLAPLLIGRTLEETVNNIYQFLYSHVQYEADGALQQLRSPACTWAQRKEGVDCKSFSVFASSILSNLGIKHFIRQIRQPYFYPEEFTHVYVVVPKDQDAIERSATFVLDATKHENIESSYLEKVDLKMTKLQHIGLNAPQDERTRKLIENFDTFCKELLQAGVPISTVDAIRAQVSKYTSQGIDPKVRITPEGIGVEDVFFKLTNAPGLGLVSAVGGAVMSILPDDFISDTFGALFANGFNFSCIGSSTSPQKSQELITNSIKPFFEKCVAKITNPSSNSELLYYFNLALEASYKLAALYGDMAKNTSWAKCTIDGHKVVAEFGAAMRSQFDALLSSPNFTVSKRTVNGTAPFTFPANMTANNTAFRIGTGGAASFPVTYPQITSIAAKTVQTPTTPVYTPPTTYTPAPDGPTNYPVNNPAPTVKVAQPSGSSNTGLIVGGIALASIPFLLPMIKKGSAKKGK